jgi:hypothetical protein
MPYPNSFRANALRVRLCLAALFFVGLCAATRAAEPPLVETVDLHRALVAATGGDVGDAPDAVDSCSGCCSSHGGITSSCAGNGHVVCHDGSVSPSCLCSSCGTSPPPPPTCSGGSYWNGSACVCPSGQIFVNGVCTTPAHTCSGGSSWNGTTCVCPTGQSFVNGVCTTPVQACSNGMQWNGVICACPTGEEFIFGQCQAVSQNFTIGGGMSGSWYDPNQSGQGFVIEVIKGTDQAQAIWFAFDNQGNHAWIAAQGPIDGNRITMDALVVDGGRFPPHFDSSAIERNSWGTLTFTFTDCNAAIVEWTTSNSAFTHSGAMSLVRLTSIEGTSCP